MQIKKKRQKLAYSLTFESVSFNDIFTWSVTFLDNI